MHVLELQPGDHRHQRDFLELPFRIYHGIDPWVPPIYREACNTLSREKNPFFEHSDAAFLIAYREKEQPVGRLAVLENRLFNQYRNEKTAFFYLFECLPDEEAAGALFETAARWARRRGLRRLVGPKGFSAMDGQGLLVQGFEHRPAFGIPYNRDYYPGLVEAAGFRPLRDLLSGYLDRSTQIPDRIHRVAEKVAKRRGLRVSNFTSRRQLRALAPKIRGLYNAALGDMPDNLPLTEREARAIADRMIWFADPRIIKIVEKDGQPVGFIFAYPDISAAVQRQRGKFFPLGWLDMFLELRRTPWVNLNGAGLIREQQGLGGTAVLFSEIIRSLVDSRYDYAELVQIRAENERMLREVKALGVHFYKTHRIYELPLDSPSPASSHVP